MRQAVEIDFLKLTGKVTSWTFKFRRNAFSPFSPSFIVAVLTVGTHLVMVLGRNNRAMGPYLAHVDSTEDQTHGLMFSFFFKLNRFLFRNPGREER